MDLRSSGLIASHEASRQIIMPLSQTQKTSSEAQGQKNGRRLIFRICSVFARLIGLQNLIRFLTASRFVVHGQSMAPALSPGQYILVDGRAYRFKGPSRGDVVVLKDPMLPGKECIKRVTGLPGEYICIEGTSVMIEGRCLEEPYLGHLPDGALSGGGKWLMGNDEYFVLGDNRSDSRDSRTFGPVHRDLLYGKVWAHRWPFGLRRVAP